MDVIKEVILGRVVDLSQASTPEVMALASCPQTRAFHAEGSVLRHTAMALEEAASLDPASGAAGAPPPALAGSILRLATLLHDAGKPATTSEVSPGVYSSAGHAEEGALEVSSLWARERAFRALPLGSYASVHALVRAHMWTFGIDAVSPGAFLRMSHVVDPHLLKQLWLADTRGRVCEDAEALSEQVEYAALVLDEHVAGPDELSLVPAGVSERVRRTVLRAVVTGEVTTSGASHALAARSDREARPGSLTYTIGLPGVGKSTWARTWESSTGGEVLRTSGRRRRDRRASMIEVLEAIPRLLGAGRDICVDATHMTRESRDVLVSWAARYSVPLHAVYFNSGLDVSLARQRTRPDAEAVPDEACKRMASRLRWPTPDEYDTLDVVEPDGIVWPYLSSTRWTPRSELRGLAATHTPPWERS